jgi:hypothetical protein
MFPPLQRRRFHHDDADTGAKAAAFERNQAPAARWSRLTFTMA